MEQIKRFRFPAIFCTALVLLALAAGVLINLLGGVAPPLTISRWGSATSTT